MIFDVQMWGSEWCGAHPIIAYFVYLLTGIACLAWCKASQASLHYENMFLQARPCAARSRSKDAAYCPSVRPSVCPTVRRSSGSRFHGKKK